jgi:hypothetical protein
LSHHPKRRPVIGEMRLHARTSLAMRLIERVSEKHVATGFSRPFRGVSAVCQDR